jgi:hypothetical protein
MCDIFHLIVEVHHKKSLKIPKVIRICKSKKGRQHTGQRIKDRQRSIKHTHKTCRRVISSYSNSGTRRVNKLCKTECHDITEILLKVALNTINGNLSDQVTDLILILKNCLRVNKDSDDYVFHVK